MRVRWLLHELLLHELLLLLQVAVHQRRVKLRTRHACEAGGHRVDRHATAMCEGAARRGTPRGLGANLDFAIQILQNS